MLSFSEYLINLATQPGGIQDPPFCRILLPPRTGKTVLRAKLLPKQACDLRLLSRPRSWLNRQWKWCLPCSPAFLSNSIVEKKANRGLKKLPVNDQKLLFLLIEDLKADGPIQKSWSNFSPSGDNKYHCGSRSYSKGIQPEKILARSGVTTWIDAGSAGAGNFIGFREHVIETSAVRILAFLNIGFAGIFGYMREGPEGTPPIWVGELCDIRLANLEEAVYMAKKFMDVIVGIKIRSGIGGSCDLPGLEPVSIAKRAAEAVGKPLMVHIGHGPPTTSELLPVLRKGDILTHAFRGDPNRLLDGNGKIIPELTDARQRGVVLDVGHGAGSFSFDTACKMLEQGIEPDVISPDIHVAMKKN